MSSPRFCKQALQVCAGLLLIVALNFGIAGAQEDAANIYLPDFSAERTPLVTVFPKYPYVARRDRIEGEAVVCFSISSKGKVVRPSVRHSSHRIFRKPAIKAMKASTYEPLLPANIDP